MQQNEITRQIMNCWNCKSGDLCEIHYTALQTQLNLKLAKDLKDDTTHTK